MSSRAAKITCKNCDYRYQGNYCPNCSQKAGAGRLKVSQVLHELWHSFTHTDKGFLTLSRMMLIRPGTVIREYLSGKRKKYFSPFTFFFLVTAINVFVVAQVYRYEDQLYAIGNAFGQWVGKNNNVIVLCSIPVMALCLQLVYLNRKINYAESVTVLFFAIGTMNFIRVFINLLYFPLIRFHHDTKVLANIFGYAIVGYILVDWAGKNSLWHWLQAIIAAGVLFAINMYAQSWALEWWMST